MLEELKEQVIRIALDAQRKGLCKHKSGNFSIISREKELVVITPSGIDRELLKPADISVLDLGLNLIEGLRPSSETLVHVEAYKARPDIGSVVHTHSKFATAFACLNKPVPAVTYELAQYRLDKSRIPVAPYGRPGTPELAASVAAALSRADLALMEKHGAIAVGKTIDDAYLAAQYLEEAAENYYLVLMIGQGKEPPVFSEAELKSWKYPAAIKQ